MVDSIVRQSRHQFGVDKDVFGPRFLKNFTDTFQHLYCCPEDDKVLHVCGFGIVYIIRVNDKKKYLKYLNFFLFQSKIIRVLNLWQKNGVFDMDIIQPLMDMANGAMVPAPAPQGNKCNSVWAMLKCL